MIPSMTNTSLRESMPSWEASMPRCCRVMVASTSMQTISANLRSRRADSIMESRSTAWSGSFSVMALRVTRNSSQLSMTMPGKITSRLLAITSSNST